MLDSEVRITNYAAGINTPGPSKDVSYWVCFWGQDCIKSSLLNIAVYFIKTRKGLSLDHAQVTGSI